MERVAKIFRNVKHRYIYMYSYKLCDMMSSSIQAQFVATLNPSPDEQLNLLPHCAKKSFILGIFLYFVQDAKRTAGEPLDGLSFCMLSKISKSQQVCHNYCWTWASHQMYQKCKMYFEIWLKG